MTAPNQGSLWHRARVAFRRFRIVTWCLILAILAALLYLNRIGLPGFLKTPLLEKLRARGVELQFSRLRWRLDRGIVAENVRFGSPNEPAALNFTINEVELQLSYRALARFQFQIDSLILHHGGLDWPVTSPSGGPPRHLSLTNIQTQLRFMPDDLWQLDQFDAGFAGGRIRLTGVVSNASAVSDWTLFQHRERTPLSVQHWADTLQQIQFTTPPNLRLDIRGDARDLQSFSVQALLDAPGAVTPWGDLSQGHITVEVRPAPPEGPVADVHIQADMADTPWANVTNLGATLQLVASARNTNTVHARMELSAAGARTEWGSGSNVVLITHWIHSLSNPIPISGSWQLEARTLTTSRGSADAVHLEGTLCPSTNVPASLSPSWAWWTNLAPYKLDWAGRVARLTSPRITADQVSCAGTWDAPGLQATQVTARLYGGTLNADARLDIATRMLGFHCESDFDVHKVSGLLGEDIHKFLSQFGWSSPPFLQAEGSLVLPDWTNRQPEWLSIRRTFALSGRFQIDGGQFRGVPSTSAGSHFTYLNETWTLPDLTAVRPEGVLDMVHVSNDRTHAYYFRVHSTIDPRALKPLFDPPAQDALDLLTFSRTPTVDGEVWGQWDQPARTTARGKVSASSFAIRGETIDSFQASLEYTNESLSMIEPRLERMGGAEKMSAGLMRIDFPTGKIHVTNGISTADPHAVARGIGGQVARAIEPYQFLHPPSVRVDGIIPTRTESDADLHFSLADGGSFAWWKLRAPRVSGKLDWVGQRLLLRDVQAELYRGRGVANAQFDFQAWRGADFSFHADFNNLDLHLLMSDLDSKTNRLEGTLTARVGVTHANTVDWRTWQGGGHLNLRDGLIWDIPVFGILSPALNAVVPGLGNSRASEATASFMLTNGIINSDDLEIRASMMRLRYWGAIDLSGQVNARAEAELLRDTWVVGRVLSVALWPVSKMFEYQITGTVQDPKSDPVFFVPRLVLFPLHPIRTLRDLGPENPDYLSTNTLPPVLP